MRIVCDKIVYERLKKEYLEDVVPSWTNIEKGKWKWPAGSKTLAETMVPCGCGWTYEEVVRYEEVKMQG